MRTSVLGIAHFHDLNEVATNAVRICKATHNDPRLVVRPLTFNPQDQNAKSPFLSPYICYVSSGKKLLKYQENSSWVIMALILMTSLIN